MWQARELEGVGAGVTPERDVLNQVDSQHRFMEEFGERAQVDKSAISVKSVESRHGVLRRGRLAVVLRGRLS